MSFYFAFLLVPVFGRLGGIRPLSCSSGKIGTVRNDGHYVSALFWDKVAKNNYTDKTTVLGYCIKGLLLCFNIACTVHRVEINLYNQTYMHWNVYTTDAQNLLLHVSALHRFHHQGVFTAVKADKVLHTRHHF
jgi:hypothetical protein